MTQEIDLKALERKAFRSTFQDGLWDIYLGALTLIGAINVSLPAELFDEYPWLQISLLMLLMLAAWLLFWAAKRFITIPRLGMVKFGTHRRKRGILLGLIMAGFLLITLFIFLLTIGALKNQAIHDWVNAWLPGGRANGLVVGALAAGIVGFTILFIAAFSDFLRGYYIAVVMALGIFLTYALDQPLFYYLAAVAIVVPGVVLLVRFLHSYPLQPGLEP
jgi:hypothetical protein